MSIEERLNYINGVQDFINCTSSKIQDTLSALGWNASELKYTDVNNAQCPFDRGHWMPSEKLPAHIEICALKKEGYSGSETLLPPSCGNEKYAIKIDSETRKQVLRSAFLANPRLKLGVEDISRDDRPIPRTADRCVSEFTVDERRVLYDFAVSQTSKPSAERNIQDIQLFENIGRTCAEPAKTTKTLEEMMIEMRDAKRRRASYKGKKVKAKSRSYTETLKNLIETQMDVLTEMRDDDSSSNRCAAQPEQEHSEAASFEEPEAPSRPQQLYEKEFMRSDHASYLGDWVAKFNRRERDDYRDSGSYRSHHQSRHTDGGFKKLKIADSGHSYEKKDRSYKRKRSRSPDAKLFSRSSSRSYDFSYYGGKPLVRDEDEISSHSRHQAKRNSPGQPERYREKSFEDEKRNKHRSRSRSKSRSKHRKHRKEHKAKKRKKHHKEQDKHHEKSKSSGGESEISL
nr:PREDICTED: U11/U12 small nuclear ribonucleoprotein 48 kDa protein-like isoform X1 [Bemisia tabaci]XP_018911996.1 PREDICTED: U11/U12 small nuclear ribonucleoprotein 48 kDa protein-like isoform X2 [Bemisia tabaci]